MPPPAAGRSATREAIPLCEFIFRLMGSPLRCIALLPTPSRPVVFKQICACTVAKEGLSNDWSTSAACIRTLSAECTSWDVSTPKLLLGRNKNLVAFSWPRRSGPYDFHLQFPGNECRNTHLEKPLQAWLQIPSQARPPEKLTPAVRFSIGKRG